MTTETMTIIGDRLKKARESRSLTIDQVQKETRIHSTVLTALEEGRCDKMLTPTYVKSFLKKYASHLGLDAKTLMDEYLTAHPEGRVSEQLPPKEDGEASGKPVIDLPALARKHAGVLFGVFAAVVIVFLGIKAVHFISERNRAHVVVAVRPDAPKARKQKVEKPAPVKPQTQVKEKEPSVAVVAPQEAAESHASAAKTEGLNLIVKAKRGVFVTANSDGVIIFKKHLPKGMTETVKADSSINLYIGNGDSVELILNGKALTKVPKGLVKDLEITRRGVRVK